jgi:hypothetical protein
MNARVLAAHCVVRSTAALTKESLYISISEYQNSGAKTRRWRPIVFISRLIAICMHPISEYQNSGANIRHWRPTTVLISRPIAIYIYNYIHM